uniref:LIM and calponin homology domains 1b n=1 Tax=Astyanax mexicanus TaxID=7994 RepID=A0A3B1JR70_ASTMX
MRKEGEDWDSPKRSIRDSGYIDCWESERSESLSPPRHARDDSFDSLDSIGSRSRHTPSPDGLLARGSSDGRGSDSECDIPHRKLPDMRRDDMLARRTSCSEPRTALPFNQYLPNKSNQTTYMPTPLRRQRTEREDNRKSWSNATSPIGGERPFRSPTRSCSEELYRTSLVTSSMTTSIIVTSPLSPSPQSSPGPCKKFLPLTMNKVGRASPTADGVQDDMRTRRSQISPKHGNPSPSHFLSVPLFVGQAGQEEKAWSESEKLQRRPSSVDNDLSPTFGHRASVSESMSMIDMRNEEDTMLPPHSQVRHELMHGQYTRMKEEESHWQDDLARWKSRRRSVSQDLIKKEEERKMMEKLLNKEDYTQRRKSIKTYREIVQDKERREHELHDAYLRARTPEEAAAVLERYAQRFTISEAVLERLKLPKLLERSVSADPTRLPTSPTTPDPFTSPSGPLQYLRQQSLPTPKFTATVEARVRGYGAEQGEVRGSSRPSHSGRSGPFHAPTPYGQGKAVSTGSRSAKRDEMERVNGEAEDGHSAREEEREQDVQREREREEDSSPLVFYPSLSQNTGDSDSTEHSVSETPLSDRYTTSHTLIHTPETECVERADPQAAGQCEMLPEAQSQEEEEREKEQTPSRPTSLPTLPAEVEEVPQTRDESSPQKEEEPGTEALQESEQCPEEQTGENTESAVISQNGTIQTPEKTQTPTPIDTAAKEVRPVLESPQRPAYKPKPASPDQPKHKTVCEPPATELDNSAQLTPLSSNPKLRWDFFTSSEPAEKKHGNEKYRREQEKLKQEWEKAQKEVEEEERRYHEEERKILEETVAPLTPHSPIPPSPCWQETTPLCGSRSLADWERRQEELEKQTTGTTEKRQREKERSEATGTKQELSWSTGSPQQQSSDQQVSQPNGQREGTGVHSQESEQQPPSQSLSWSDKTENQQQSSDSWQKSGSLDCNRNIQPATAGRRRSDSIEHAGAKSSHSSSSYTDTQQPPSSPNRSVSGKKLCSSCGHPLGKGAAMIIETLSLYFHIQCFKCGICKGQLGDTTTGTDVRIRNGLLNCHQCYIRSRSAGQPTTL